MKYFKFFYRYLIPLWKKEALLILLNIIIALLGLVNPYVAKLMIDGAYKNRDLKLFLILICISSSVFLVSFIVNGIISYLQNYIRTRINLNLNLKVFKKIQKLPYGFFQDSSTGENLYKLNYDIDQVVAFIADILPQVVTMLPRTILILAIVFYMNWKMALFALVLMPFLHLWPHYFTRRMQAALKTKVELSQGIFKQLQEVLRHVQLVKVFGKEDFQAKRHIRNLTEKMRFSLKSSKLEMTNMFANGMANRMILGLVTFYGGYQLIRGRMTLGSLSAITIYLSQLVSQNGAFVSFFQQISLASVSCERLALILDYHSSQGIEEKGTQEIIFPKGCIEFNNVSFGYRQDKKVIEGLSFFVPGGLRLALVGPSGLGKTTILNLILRLYNPQSGQILIDGNDIKYVKAKSLYAQIGVVLQEPCLWNDTIANNIRYGRQDAGPKEIAQAAEIACIDDYIRTLPRGYDTVIGENACKISEGQKQRIAIARAVIKKPKILFLDEALSSVDTELEGKIISNIGRFITDSTVVVVSHRFSAINRMDSVYFLEDYQRITVGSHDELLKNNVKYQRYIERQLEEINVV